MKFFLPIGSAASKTARKPPPILPLTASQAPAERNFGGRAAGNDRNVMLLAEAPNIRDEILIPMTQRAEDLMMNAPAEATSEQLMDLGLRVLPRDD